MEQHPEHVPYDPETMPVDPGRIMAQIERNAVKRQYIGTLADGDAKSLVSRQYSTSKEEAAAVDRVVGSPLTLYISAGDFVRHAVWELLQAYEQAGFPDEFIPDVTAHLRNMREASHRLRLRQEFSDILTVYETSLNEGMDTGDWELVTSTFESLEGYLDRTPDVHWRVYLMRSVLRSGVVKQAVEALSEAGHGFPKQEIVAERWTLRLEGLAE